MILMSSFWDDVSEPPDHLAARERGMTAREESIWEGSDGDMSINQIHNNVAEHNPSASTSQVQEMTVDLVRSLLSDGLFELSPKAVREDASLEERIDWIRSLYVEHFDEPTKWWPSIWLYVTDKGRQEADRIREKYFSNAASPRGVAEELTAEESQSLQEHLSGHPERGRDDRGRGYPGPELGR